MRAPHTQPAAWPTISSGRFAESIVRSDEPPADAAVALLGAPDDTGVRLNNGRAGAQGGPAAFRAALAKFGSSYDAARDRDVDLLVWDAGDLIASGSSGSDRAMLESSLHETHRRLSETLEWIHARGMVSVCLGGGHDLTFPAIRALSRRAAAPVGGVNIDAHLDVRETAGSGMVFRSAIDQGFLDPARFSVLGVGRFSNAREHVEWLRQRGGELVLMREMMSDPSLRMHRALERARGGAAASAHRGIFVTFDLDSIDAGFAPGVSALNPRGLTPAAAGAIAEEAGRAQSVGHFDLMELNAAQDEHGRTARLAVYLFLCFLSGMASPEESRER